MPASTKAGKPEPSWLLPPAFEIKEENEDLPEDDPARVISYGDEIVDEVTVGILVRGTRRVASTPTERRIAAQIMIETTHLDPQQVAEHIGTLVAKLPEIIEPLGWRVLPRTNDEGKRVRPTAMFQRIGTETKSSSNKGGKA